MSARHIVSDEVHGHWEFGFASMREREIGVPCLNTEVQLAMTGGRKGGREARLSEVQEMRKLRGMEEHRRNSKELDNYIIKSWVSC